MKKWKRTGVVLCMTAMLLGGAMSLSGCQRVSKEQLAFREGGIASLEQGDYSGALDQFEKALADSNRVSDFETDVLKYRAEAEYQLEDFEAAAHTYDLLNQLDKKRPEYDYYWAMCLAKSGNPQLAEEKLAEGKAQETGRKSQEAGGKDQKSDGKTQDADGKAKGGKDESRQEPEVQNTKSTAPGYAEAMNAVADAWLAENNTEKADAVYTQLMSEGLADTRLYSRLAKTCMEQQDYEKALEYAEQGLALSDDLAKKDLRFNQAVCYEYLGEFSKALELFRQYVSEFGSDEAAEHEIAFLVTR